TFLAQNRLISLPRPYSQLLLPRRVRKNDRAILGTDIVALSHALRGIVGFPKDLQQLLETNFIGLINHTHHLGVTSHPATHLLIGRIGRKPARVSHCRYIYT